MRKIFKTAAFKANVIAFNRALFLTRPNSFKMPMDRLDDFNAKVTASPADYSHTIVEMTDYIKKIQQDYFRIIDADDAEMEILKNEFEGIIQAGNISEKFQKGIVEAMGYEDLRDEEFLIFLSSMGIKTCVYCHSQLTLVVKKYLYLRNYPLRGKVVGDVRKWKGLLELDHKHPKSKYPFLATSFYNLYPSCGNCNGSKSRTEIDFTLYSDNNNLELFKFFLDKQSIINYKVSANPEDLEIGLAHVLAKNAINDELLKKYENIFSISKIYNMQKDVAEELIIKKAIYDKPYVDSLLKRFKRLFPNKGIIDRILIGNYDLPEDVHKRPMAKFVQDISKDIGLL